VISETEKNNSICRLDRLPNTRDKVGILYLLGKRENLLRRILDICGSAMPKSNGLISFLPRKRSGFAIGSKNRKIRHYLSDFSGLQSVVVCDCEWEILLDDPIIIEVNDREILKYLSNL